jgi:hypothetical protein
VCGGWRPDSERAILRSKSGQRSVRIRSVGKAAFCYLSVKDRVFCVLKLRISEIESHKPLGIVGKRYSLFRINFRVLPIYN